MEISRQLSLQIMQNLPEKIEWSYHVAFVLQGVLADAFYNKNEEVFSKVEAKFDALISDDGEIQGYKKTEYNLDNINPGKLLFIFYNKTKKEKYKKAIFNLYDQLQSQPRNNSEGFWHKKIYPWQMWLNGFYMYGPFYAQFAQEFGSKNDFDDLLQQINLIETNFKDPQTRLLCQAWDQSRKQLWVESSNGRSPTIFARSVGWYAMALVDILDFITDEDKTSVLYKTLIKAIQSLAEAILLYQDEENGMWFQVMDRPTHRGNFHETSASAMFVYFLYKIVRKNYYQDSEGKVLQAAKKGYKGICSKLSIDEKGFFHVNGICEKSGLGRNPYRDGSYKYYVEAPTISDDNKGIGAFIYASIEHKLVTL